MTLDKARERYASALRSTFVSRSEPEVGKTYDLVDEDAADSLIAALEAENERLKCCGNCGERGGDYGDECCRSWLGPVEPYHAYRPADNVAPADHCHFTPSRWQRREG